MSIARRHQYKVVERAIQLEEIANASEVFLVGTAAELTPVRQIGAHHYTPGKVTQTLLDDFEQLVRKQPAEVELLTAA
jgi:branched-chain amino acid aminotransferase